MPKKLFLLDGMALTYRAYFSMIRTPLMNSKGMNTSAIYGFINTINKLLQDESPDYIGVAFDTEEPTFRHKMFKDYKATREAMPDDLIPQIDRIKEVIGAYNIPMIEMHGYEADDVIGTLVKVAEKEGVWSFMVTPDKDFMQLVNKNIHIYKPARGGASSKQSDVEILGIAEVKERFGVPPDRVIDVLSLMGDKVDNVPGVRGIGEKTAAALIQEFGSLEGLYQNIDKISKPKLKENLITFKEDAFLSKKLVTIDTNVPVKIDFHKLIASEKNVALLEKIFTELEFKSLLKKLQGSEQEINIQAVRVEERKEPVPGISKTEDFNSFAHKYFTIKKAEDLVKLVNVLKKEEEFVFDTETTTDDPLTARLVGFSFSYNEGEAFYVPILFMEKTETDLFGAKIDKKGKTETEQLPEIELKEALEMIKPLLESKNIRKVGHNIKFDTMVMKEHGINLENIGFDTMIAAYILNPESSYKTDFLSEIYLNYKCIPLENLAGNEKTAIAKTIDLVPYRLASDFVSEEADVTLRLYHRIEYELKKISLDGLCSEIEFPLVEVLADMEYTGVKVDIDMLNNLNTDFKKRELTLEKGIWKDAGEEFNLNSPKQLSEILFNKLKLAPLKKIKTGFSTDTSVLEDLKDLHPIAEKLLEFRIVNKLRTTYTEGLLKIINKKTGRIHTSYNQTVAATGRLSSANPNLQNIPIRTEIGRELRKAFIPSKKGNIMLSADYSQIELRILAHLAGDENMVKAFERKHDIHRETASKIFKVKPEMVDSNMRRKAKEVNFGIIYGIQAFGLASRLNIDQNEAREIIQAYFGTYTKINKWIEDTKIFARENGYTETLTGRRRYLQNINNKNSVVRQRDERIAINMPVQGAAADLIKIAMINIHNEFKKMKLKSKMILQVHDELVFDCEKDEFEEVKKIVENKMKRALKLDVPIDVDTGSGSNWFDAHT
ncbi:MAG: DNA polymerase I [Ignavibacteria bacterium]